MGSRRNGRGWGRERKRGGVVEGVRKEQGGEESNRRE